MSVQRSWLHELMTDVPPCRCPGGGVHPNCVHHGAAWERIAARFEEKSHG